MRGYAMVALERPKNILNIGSVMRAAGNYGVAGVVISKARNGTKPGITDTMKAYRHIPLTRTEDLRSAIPYDCVPVAVDLIPGAKHLPNYVHPERAIYIFGPEDGTLGKEVTDFCHHTVFVDTTGCMNLAAAVNVVLYDRMAKALRGQVTKTGGQELK